MGSTWDKLQGNMLWLTNIMGTELLIFQVYVLIIKFSNIYSLFQITFNPQGTAILTASSDKTARIWDPETGNCKQILEGHTDEIFSCAFNYEGNIIITGKLFFVKYQSFYCLIIKLSNIIENYCNCIYVLVTHRNVYSYTENTFFSLMIFQRILLTLIQNTFS